jgi:hypothetical protein
MVVDPGSFIISQCFHEVSNPQTFTISPLFSSTRSEPNFLFYVPTTHEMLTFTMLYSAAATHRV